MLASSLSSLNLSSLSPERQTLLVGNLFARSNIKGVSDSLQCHNIMLPDPIVNIDLGYMVETELLISYRDRIIFVHNRTIFMVLRRLPDEFCNLAVNLHAEGYSPVLVVPLFVCVALKRVVPWQVFFLSFVRQDNPVDLVVAHEHLIRVGLAVQELFLA